MSKVGIIGDKDTVMAVSYTHLEWTPKRTESGQGVDRQWTGVWTAERHFLSIRIPACI